MKTLFEQLFGRPQNVVYNVEQSESNTINQSLIMETYSVFAITINPNPHKRIALAIPGRKSRCFKYDNYTNDHQETILDGLLKPIKHFTYPGDVCYELTELKNLHLHTYILIKKDDFHGIELEALERYKEEIHKRCTDSKDNYECLDVRELTTEADLKRWIVYIHKAQDKRSV